MKRLLVSLILALSLALPAAAQVVEDPSTGASISSGSTISGCNAITAILNVVTGALTCNPASVVNGTVSTAGRSILTIRDTISGSSATSNFLNVTGTVPATLSADTNAFLLSMTTVNQNQNQVGVHSTLSGNIGAGGVVSAIRGDISASNAGAYASGAIGSSSGSAAENIGVHGFATGGTGNIGGFFHLSTITVPTGTAALVADNRSVAANIFEARDNGTAVFTIADGGAVTMGASGIANTLVTDSHFGLGGATNGFSRLANLSVMTPDSAVMSVGSTSEAVHFSESADSGFDFNNGRCATSACTDPALIIHSHNQATNQYVQASHDGTLAHIDGQAGTNGTGQYAFAGAKDLTEASATVVVDIPVASGAYTGATINWTVVASDATDHQSRRGSTYLAVVNKAGTETCTVGDVGTTVVAVSAGTLTVTTGQDTTGTNVCTFTINAVSSLTQTVLRALYSVQVDGPGIPAAR